ncbi:MAG: TIR domain-containing protein [Lachnospiraceae bacterium]|nr:TIR domain-containing protein [Lachnospiraceae bacterium]
MAILKCKMCGGELDIIDDSNVVECEYCGSKQTIPDVDDEKKLRLYDRANKLRMACDYDKSAGVYESIVAEFPDEAEAYWGLILCKYGIEYVDDPATGKKIPTCHRSSFDSVMEDPSFEMVMENADSIAMGVYHAEAKQIEEIRRRIVEISNTAEDYDIFICYKETAEDGDRTIDSVIAQDVYDALTSKGYKVFFARVSLEDKLGQEYEPYIFSALNSSEIMLVFGTEFNNFNAIWVKNEWSRFLKLIERNSKKSLIPCYKNIDAYDMPKEFARLQAQDMGKVGAVQDLIRGIEKLIGTRTIQSEIEGEIKEKKVDNSAKNNVAVLLQRGNLALEDEEWDNANKFFEETLNYDANCADAYLGKLMSDLKVSKLEQLNELEKSFSTNKNYKKVERFGEESLVDILKEYLRAIEGRNNEKRMNDIYNDALRKIESYQYSDALTALESIRGFLDVEKLIQEITTIIEFEKMQCEERERAKRECERTKDEWENKTIVKIVDEIKSGYDNRKMESLQLSVEKLNKEKKVIADRLKSYNDYKQNVQDIKREYEELVREKSGLESLNQSLTIEKDGLGIFAIKRKAEIDNELQRIPIQQKKVQEKLEELEKFLETKCENAIDDFIVEKNKRMEEIKSELLTANEMLQTLNSNDCGYQNEEATIEKFVCEINSSGELDELVRIYYETQFNNVNKHDVIKLGRYQNEDIEWIVLDKQDDKCLLLAKYAVEILPFDCYREDEKSEWGNCTLRRWLNEYFFDVAFVNAEKNVIETTELNDESTDDKLFLFNKNEAELYVEDKNLMCELSSYLKKRAVSDSSINFNENPNYGWWLRGGYKNKDYVLVCCGDFEEDRFLYNGCKSALVRPAMWININDAEQIDNSIGTEITINTIKNNLITKLRNDYTEDYYRIEFASTDKYSVVKFGEYQKEALRWIVIDKIDNKCLLLSKDIIDYKYHMSKETKWKCTDLRKWLNEDFYNVAFLKGEKKFISTTFNTGEIKEDKVFLLSNEEVERLLPDKLKRKCNNSQWSNYRRICLSSDEKKDYFSWWLRTEVKNNLLGVDDEGSTWNYGFNPSYHDYCGIRPSIWLDISGINIQDSYNSSDLENNKDTKDYYKKMFKKSMVGYDINFGEYQDEDIEWVVLDKTDTSVFVISKYLIDVLPFHNAGGKVIWKDCSLRNWLNGTFYSTAFCLEEKKMIKVTENTGTYLTEKSNDYVFILNVDETKKYMESEEIRSCRLTSYAVAKFPNYGGVCEWWLRDEGEARINCLDYVGYIVDCDGTVFNSPTTQVESDVTGVRPAMWIDFSSVL